MSPKIVVSTIVREPFMWKCYSTPRRNYPRCFRIVVFYIRGQVSDVQMLEIPWYIQEYFLPEHPDHEGLPYYGLVEPGVLYLPKGGKVEGAMPLIDFCEATGKEVSPGNASAYQCVIRREVLESDDVCHVFLAEGNELKELDEVLLIQVAEQAAGMDMLIVEFEENDEEDMD